MPARLREIAATPPSCPASIAEAVRGYAWARDTVGESGGAVYRLHAAGRETLYLKHGSGEVAADIAGEMARLTWLGRYLSVPALRRFELSPDEAWLLMTAMPGRTAFQLLEEEPARRRETVTAIVAYLRALHALPAAECPFNSAHPLRLAAARRRMAAGVVDTSDFGEEHHGWTAERLWDHMAAMLPFDPDPVVTHGDFSLDNILIQDGRVTGCIDLGRVGVADRYQDLAILWDCLGEFDESLRAVMFGAYGMAAPDRRKIDFHLCLDEFF